MGAIERQRERVRKKKEREAKNAKEASMSASAREEMKKKMIDDANKQSSESVLAKNNISGYETNVQQEKKKREAKAAKKKDDIKSSSTKGTLDRFKKSVSNTDLSPFATGERRADEILGPEGLRTQEMKDVMDMRKKQATEGISPEQQLAMKTKMAKQMMQAEQAAGLKLGSALGGVKGAAAGSQVRSLQAQGLQARAGIERDMFMAQEAAKQQGINALEDTARFDVSQLGKEMELKATLGMGFEALQAQRDAAALSAQATRDAAPKSRGGLLGGSIIPGLL